jgi:hypothetical protein
LRTPTPAADWSAARRRLLNDLSIHEWFMDGKAEQMALGYVKGWQKSHSSQRLEWTFLTFSPRAWSSRIQTLKLGINSPLSYSVKATDHVNKPITYFNSYQQQPD